MCDIIDENGKIVDKLTPGYYSDSQIKAKLMFEKQYNTSNCDDAALFDRAGMEVRYVLLCRRFEFVDQDGVRRSAVCQFTGAAAALQKVWRRGYFGDL